MNAMASIAFYISTDKMVASDLCLTFYVLNIFNFQPHCLQIRAVQQRGKKMLNFRVFGKPWLSEGSYVSMSHKNRTTNKVPSKSRKNSDLHQTDLVLRG